MKHFDMTYSVSYTADLPTKSFNDHHSHVHHEQPCLRDRASALPSFGAANLMSICTRLR